MTHTVEKKRYLQEKQKVVAKNWKGLISCVFPLQHCLFCWFPVRQRLAAWHEKIVQILADANFLLHSLYMANREQQTDKCPKSLNVEPRQIYWPSINKAFIELAVTVSHECFHFKIKNFTKVSAIAWFQECFWIIVLRRKKLFK